MSEQQLKEQSYQNERSKINEEIWQKVHLDGEKQKYLSKINKQKHDKILELKRIHTVKREELNQKEIETCLSKLNEINNKLAKSNQLYNEKMDEKTSYLKTQSLLRKYKPLII